ncbi:MAG: DedA family protein [Thermoplasmata archaeon]|nr:DedA family protein [Thermoplasmata archaeon]
MSLVAFMVQYILSVIIGIGYFGIFVLMALESACIPIPSEVIMPFAGFASSPSYPGSKFDLYLVSMAGALGNLAGSLAAYYFGYYVGRAGVLRYGRYFLVTEKHLRSAENWFEKHGDKAVFIARLLPVIRTFISLPAGIARMNIWKFSVYSFVGSIPWCVALAYLGYILGENYTLIIEYGSILDYVMIVCIAVLGAYFLIRFYRERKSGKE